MQKWSCDVINFKNIVSKITVILSLLKCVKSILFSNIPVNFHIFPFVALFPPNSKHQKSDICIVSFFSVCTWQLFPTNSLNPNAYNSIAFCGLVVSHDTFTTVVEKHLICDWIVAASIIWYHYMFTHWSIAYAVNKRRFVFFTFTYYHGNIICTFI